ncbi:ligand-gated channel [Marinibactrum halimedae]|uniref:Ligand-gated channel n=1 Tax=Marinibactrum halimedae TaxID=1444977 RepID=A0AA37T4B1_9GAMM|nr:ligand-gated channel [Marinibactrum halimedae]
MTLSLSSLNFSSLSHASDNTSWLLEEVTVEGNQDNRSYQSNQTMFGLTNTPVFNTPQSIQIINASLINDQQLTTLSDALTNVSGVVPNDESETLLINPIIRGFESEIFVDGLMSYGDTAVVDPASLAGIERIEVAKGPTSSLYGGGSGAPVGGLINVVTKTPKKDSFYHIGVRTGSFDTLATTLDINQVISNKHAFRLAGEIHDSEDYIDDVSIKRLSLYPSWKTHFDNDSELLIRGFHSSIEQLEYPGLPAELVDQPNINLTQFSGASDAPDTEITNNALHGRYQLALNDQLQWTLQLRHYDNDLHEFAAFPFLNTLPLMGTQAVLIRGIMKADTQEWTLDSQLTLNTQFGSTEHEVVVGLNYDKTEYKVGMVFDPNFLGIVDYAEENTVSFGAPFTVTDDQRAENNYTTLALYAQDYITLNEATTLQLSGRVSRYTLQDDASGINTDEQYTEFDPRIGISHQLNSELSLFAGAATGSRLSLYYAGSNASSPKPETSESIEAGVKFNMADGKLVGTIAAYQLNRENIPTIDLTDPNFGSVQSGEQQSKGIELDAIWEPTPQWSLLANYAYTNAEYSEPLFNATLGQINTGTDLARVPQNSGRLAGRYRFENGILQNVAVGLGVTYAEGTPIVDGSNILSDDYTIFDAQLNYSTSRYDIGLTVRNLTDNEYVTPYQYFRQEVIRPGAPLNAQLTLKLYF